MLSGIESFITSGLDGYVELMLYVSSVWGQVKIKERATIPQHI